MTNFVDDDTTLAFPKTTLVAAPGGTGYLRSGEWNAICQAAYDMRGKIQTLLAGGGSNFVSVKNAPYNAVGDGSTDDTTAIQSAHNAAVTAGLEYWTNSGPNTFVTTGGAAGAAGGGGSSKGGGAGGSGIVIKMNLSGDGT